MNENITVNLDESSFLGLLTNYYKEHAKGQNIEITAVPKVKLRGIWEDEIIDVEVTLKSTQEIDSYSVTRSERLTKENIIEALAAKLNSEEYFVKDISFQTQMRSYSYFTSTGEAKFIGVTANLGIRQMKQALKQN